MLSRWHAQQTGLLYRSQLRHGEQVMSNPLVADAYNEEEALAHQYFCKVRQHVAHMQTL